MENEVANAFFARACSAIPLGVGVWTTLGATFVVAFVLFVFFGGALALPALRGRKIKRRCACAMSRDVLKFVEERERAARNAKLYKPENVNPKRLPQTSRELCARARRFFKESE